MADLCDALQAGLGASYTLEREVGRGGMATVYLARDTKHGRMVALKVLHPDLALRLGPERFRREITFAAKLQHPHILSVYDSGETASGALWFTMPYVEGEALSERLRREGRLPVADTLRITREVASALAYAHQHGVVHRDIKPANILLTEQGDALVADFGIARAVGAQTPDTPDTTAHLTETGHPVGTPAYMSPEQSAGIDVDARTDIYSLGAVCYEMLTGELPYRSAPVPRARAQRGEVPEFVDVAVRRALAIDPARRFGAMAEFAAALVRPSGAVAAQAIRRVPRTVWASAGALLLAAGALFTWRHAGASATPPPTVAVLAFENLGDSSDAYFADGIADEIRGKLTSLAGLRVIARASSIQYKRSAKPPQEIARELGARYLLTGQVRWERTTAGGSHVRVNPELIEVVEGTTPTSKWQQPFDADLSNVFEVQADIAGKVASALNVKLGAAQHQTLAEQPTTNLAAYDAYLKGEHATQGMGVADVPSLRRGAAFYARAVELDSNFVQAWTSLAIAHTALYLDGGHAPADARVAERAIERARAIAPDHPETQLAIGNFQRYVRLDVAGALAPIEQGLARAPENVSLLDAAMAWESGLGRWDSAVVHGQRALALDPRSFHAARDLGFVFHYLRRYPEAQAAYDRALALAPGNLLIIDYRATLALSQGDLPRARTILGDAIRTVDTTALLAFVSIAGDLYWMLDEPQQRRLLTLTPAAFDGDSVAWAMVRAQTYWLRGDTTRSRANADTARRLITAALAVADDWQLRANLGLVFAMIGRRPEAIENGERAASMLPISRDAVIGPYPQQILARIYMMVGEPDQALDHLEPLVRIPYILSRDWLRIDPTWAPLRGSPRFDRLVTPSASPSSG